MKKQTSPLKCWVCYIMIVFSVLSVASCSSSQNSNRMEHSKANETGNVQSPAYSSKSFYATYYNDQGGKNTATTASENLDQTASAFYDKHGNSMLKLDKEGFLVLVENGVIYTRFEKSLLEDTSVTEFYYYNFDSGEADLIGSLDDVYYIASYEAINVDKIVYLRVETGSIYDGSSQSVVCVLDTAKKELKTINLGKNLSPFNSMACFNDKLYVCTIPVNDVTVLWEYDMDGSNPSKIKEYHFDNEMQKGQYIRSIASDSDHLYVLRGEMGGDKPAKLFVDTYDKEIKSISVLDITDEIYSVTDEADLMSVRYDELRQPVYSFDVINGMLYYENRSVTRALLLIEEDGAKARSVPADKTNICSRTYRAHYAETNESRICYYNSGDKDILFYDPRDDAVQKYQLKIHDKLISPCQIHYNSNGKMLIVEARDDIGNTTGMKIYYVDFSDLKKGF